MKFIRSILRKRLAASGYDIKPREAINGTKLNILPFIISQMVQRNGVGFIIQIGANDGKSSDPVFNIIKQLSLPALLVEPLPYLFQSLIKNYADQPQVILEQCAIDSVDGQREIFYVSSIENCPGWAQQLASFNISTILKHKSAIPNLEKLIKTMSVETATLETLLRKHGINNVLLLQVDTEGFDFEVIKLAIAAGCLPSVINYEYKHLPFTDQQACRKLLASYGYSFLNCHQQDTLAVRTFNQQ